MWLLDIKKHKKCSGQHVWRPKFKQGTKELYVVCVVCKNKEKVTWYSDYQKQILLEEFFK